ncbi:hypothetical protein [Pseudoalteromonas phenolica]|nr:hypothetical protein [Pseudoalteromonas phenolica]
MMELLVTFMMLHALLLILLSMPKYNKAIKEFPKRDKKLEKTFKLSGFTLLFLSFLIMLFVNGLGVGIAWFCALVTLIGTLLSILNCFNAAKTAQIVTFIPQKLFGRITAKSGLLYLGLYPSIFLLFSF